MSLTIPNNFVERYDQGQKKLVASELDANFDAIETAVNTTVVHLAETETITGNKTFSGNVAFSGTATAVSPASTSEDSTKIATTEWVHDVIEDEAGDGTPVGTIIWSANASVPAGYLLCNGSAVGRATYPALFDAIGTAFGSGDGSTTFNLPNLIDKFIEGSNTAGTLKAAGLPNITGSATGLLTSYGPPATTKTNGCVQQTATNISQTRRGDGGLGDSTYTVDVDASRVSSIYGASNTVQPPAVTALPCIKAFSSVVGDATVVAGQLVNEIQSKVALDGSNTSSIGSVLSTYMAHAAMPSGQYVDLTVPASGGTVEAPADGWIMIIGAASAAGQYVNLWTSSIFTINRVTSSGSVATYIPISKNDVCTVAYTAANGITQFKFIYANGSAPTV